MFRSDKRKRQLSSQRNKVWYFPLVVINYISPLVLDRDTRPFVSLRSVLSRAQESLYPDRYARESPPEGSPTYPLDSNSARAKMVRNEPLFSPDPPRSINLLNRLFLRLQSALVGGRPSFLANSERSTALE